MIACAGEVRAVQPFLPPDPLHPFVIDGHAFRPQPPTHVAAGQLPNLPAQVLLPNRRHRHGPALGVAVLSGQTAGTALRNPESILQNTHGSTQSFRAQKFPSANSYCFAEACG